MDEHEMDLIREYQEVNEQLEAGQIPALDEVGLRRSKKKLELELGGDLLAQVKGGKFVNLKAKPDCDVLVLTSSPHDMTKLDLEEETDQIRAECTYGKFKLSVTPRFGGIDEVGKWIREFTPKCLHFAGHGARDGGLWLEDEHGRSSLVNPNALARLMKMRRWKPEVVFLNACWTEEAAEPFLDLANWVIGMSAKIPDDVAKKFARAFYRALSGGDSVQEAYKWALGELALGGHAGKMVKLIRGSQPLRARDRGRASAVITANKGPESKPVPDRGDGDPGSQGDDHGGGVGKPETHEVDETARKYPVWFGTNRVPRDESDFSKGFGRKRGDKVWYGCCEVTIPESHKVGSVGSGWWKRMRKGDDRLKVDWETMQDLENEAFWASLNNAVGQLDLADDEEPMAMVYVHGYRVTFKGAAIRAAQIGCDVKLTGPMAFYSWPSKGKLSGYVADGNTVGACIPFLKEFLRGFVAELEGIKKVHLLAHSMGNRLVLDAVNELNREFGTKLFDQVVLAAADVDRQRFMQYAGAYREIARRTTLYVSNADRALQSSEFVNAWPRAGYFDPVTILDGIDTVRANKVSQGWLGHGYYAEAREIISDIHQLFRWNASPGTRATIREVDDGSGLSWELVE